MQTRLRKTGGSGDRKNVEKHLAPFDVLP